MVAPEKEFLYHRRKYYNSVKTIYENDFEFYQHLILLATKCKDNSLNGRV